MNDSSDDPGQTQAQYDAWWNQNFGSGTGGVAGMGMSNGNLVSNSSLWDPNAAQSWAQTNLGRQFGQDELTNFQTGLSDGRWGSYGSGMDQVYNMLKQTAPEYNQYQQKTASAYSDMGSYFQQLMQQGVISPSSGNALGQPGLFSGTDGNYYQQGANGSLEQTPMSNIDPNTGKDIVGSTSAFLDPTTGAQTSTGQANYSKIDPGEWAAIALLTAISGGAASAGLAGAGAASSLGGGAGVGGIVDGTAAGYAGLDAASAATLGGGASVGGGAALGGLGAAGAAGAASGLTGVPPPANPALGAGAGASAATGAGGLGSLLQQLGGSGGGLSSIINALTGGSGSSSTGGSSSSGSGLNLGSLVSLLGGLNDASAQGKASSTMQQWLASQQSKIDNLYSPGSAEYNSLWDEMSRKDAAAGRNSQYGPRSVDLAARVAQIKADETQKFTTGTSKALADALNQNASKYSGLSSALTKSLTGGSGVTNLSSILSTLGLGSAGLTNLGSGMSIGANGAINGIGNDGWTGGTLSNDDIDNIINGLI